MAEFFLHGCCPPESYYKARPALTARPWRFWHAWFPSPNLKAIFVRDRDSNLNSLDGVRALAYLWVLNDHFYQVFNQAVPGFTAWWSNYGGITVVEQAEKGDQGVTSFFVLSGFLIPFILTKEVLAHRPAPLHPIPPVSVRPLRTIYCVTPPPCLLYPCL